MLKVCKHFSALYMIQLGLYLKNNTINGEGSELPAPTFPPRLRPRNMQHFITKPVWYLPSLALREVFCNTFTRHFSYEHGYKTRCLW